MNKYQKKLTKRIRLWQKTHGLLTCYSYRWVKKFVKYDMKCHGL